MSGAAVRFVRADEEFEVAGFGRFSNDGAGELGGPIATIGPASITSLQRAVRAADLYFGDGESQGLLSIWVTETLPEDFDEDYSPVSQVSFLVGSRDFTVSVIVFLTTPALTEVSLAQIVTPFLVRRRCRLVEVEAEGSPTQTYWRIQFALSTRRRIVADAYELGCALRDLLEAIDGSDLSASKVADLIRGGKADILIGTKESELLEAKPTGYILDREGEKIELAQDVARFANAERGGLLVVGLRITKRPTGDTIRAVTPVALAQLNPRRYRAVIDRRIFPPIENLEVEAVETDANLGLLIILIPPQPEELKPFLVHGAIAADRAEGAFISIVRRRGEDSIPVTPAAIHSMPAAGRALMRGGGERRRRHPLPGVGEFERSDTLPPP